MPPTSDFKGADTTTASSGTATIRIAGMPAAALGTSPMPQVEQSPQCA
jgi:hypothetical protein